MAASTLTRNRSGPNRRESRVGDGGAGRSSSARSHLIFLWPRASASFHRPASRPRGGCRAPRGPDGAGVPRGRRPAEVNSPGRWFTRTCTGRCVTHYARASTIRGSSVSALSTSLSKTHQTVGLTLIIQVWGTPCIHRWWFDPRSLVARQGHGSGSCISRKTRHRGRLGPCVRTGSGTGRADGSSQPPQSDPAPKSPGGSSLSKDCAMRLWSSSSSSVLVTRCSPDLQSQRTTSGAPIKACPRRVRKAVGADPGSLLARE